MADMAANLKGLINKLNSSSKKVSIVWDSSEVRAILKKTEITNFSLFDKLRTVKLNKQEDLIQILLYLPPSEVSDDYTLALDSSDGMIRLQIYNWQFEISV